MKQFLFCLLLLCPIYSSMAQPVMRFDHDKYWHYRWRLTHLFLKEGETDYGCQDPHDLISGYSIPAGDLRRKPDSVNIKQKPEDVIRGKGMMHFGDGTSFLGWYIGVLSTEWRLLRNEGKPTTDVEEELYYAMRAYERLDKAVGILFPPKTPICSLDGFFGRDDVTPRFIQTYFPAASFSTSDYWSGNNVNGVYRPDPRAPSEVSLYNSVDQVSDLMMGFALVVKCLDTWTNYQGYNFKTQAKLYTRLMAQHLQAGNYFIREPISGQIVHYGGLEAQIDAYGVSRAAARIVNEKWGSQVFPDGQFDAAATNDYAPLWQWHQTLTADVFNSNTDQEYTLGYRHELAAVGHSWQFGAVPVKCYTLRIKWLKLYIDFWRYQFNIDPTGIQQLVSTLLGKAGLNLICSPVPYPSLTINTTDFTLSRQGAKFNTQIYALLHQYLHGGVNEYNPPFIYSSIIRSAPCQGPYHFPDDADFTGVPGWRSSIRWQKRRMAFNGGEHGQVFNGLDYMLLYNLYALQYPNSLGGARYEDELNRVFSGQSLGDGRYYGFESLSLTNHTQVTPVNEAVFVSPEITLSANTTLGAGVTLSAPANGVNLECDNSNMLLNAVNPSNEGQAIEEAFTFQETIDTAAYQAAYQEYMEAQLEAKLDSVRADLDSRKYVPLPLYIQQQTQAARRSTENRSQLHTASQVLLYPNPASGWVTVESPEVIVQVRIRNVLGQTVQTIRADGSHQVTLNLSALPSETYLCEIQTANQTFSKPLIKTR